MASHTPKDIPAPASYIPSARSSGSGGRRNFSEADKKRIVEEACREGGSISGVARKYGIGARLLFRWKQELAPTGQNEPTIVPVTLSDAPDPLITLPHSISAPAPVIVERTAPGVEVELVGGRRVRFERDVDPETVRRLVAVLEGDIR